MSRAVLADVHLSKTFVQMVVGSRLTERERDDRLDYDMVKERHQQIQMAIAGTAGSVLSWSDPIEIDFDIYFACAPGNRDSNFIYPHFTYGAAIYTPDPVMAVAIVQSWIRDGNYTVTGANIVWGAMAPSIVTFNGSLHLNFQGYGAAPDVDSTTVEDENN